MMGRKPDVLVCIDRDGTLIYDNNYHLGRDNYWKSKIKICDGTVEGMKKLDAALRTRVCRMILTNQPGVAIRDFKRLTQKRAEKVTGEIMHMFKREGAFFDGYAVCPHPSQDYVESHPEFEFDSKFICPDCDCFKPNVGMIRETLTKKNLDPKNTRVYVIGDRVSDVQTGINAGGVGILVPFGNRKEDVSAVKKLQKKYSSRTYIAKDFIDAVDFIIKSEK